MQARRIARAEQRALAQLDPPPRPDSPSWDNLAFLSLSEDEESRWTEHVAQPRHERRRVVRRQVELVRHACGDERGDAAGAHIKELKIAAYRS